MPVSRILGIVAALSLVALIGLQVVVGLGFFWVANVEALFASFGIAMGYGMIGMFCAKTAERGRQPKLMFSGVAAGGIAALGWCATMYFAIATGNFPFNVGWVLVPLSGWLLECCMIAAIFRIRRQIGQLDWMRRATIGVGAVFMAHVVLATCHMLHLSATDAPNWRFKEIAETSWRIGLVLGLLWCFFFVATAVLALAPTMHRKETPRSERLRFRLTCPRCGLAQHILTEGDRCGRCRLLVKVNPA